VQDNIREHHSLDKEAEQTALTSAEICNEFNEEVITDLSNNVHIREEIDWQGPDTLWQVLSGLFYRFEHGTEPNKLVPFGKKPNWIVTNKVLAAELKKVVDFAPRPQDDPKPRPQLDKLTSKKTGTLGQDLTLIECDHLLPHDILIGYKEGHSGSGYCWSPYVPLTRTPVILDPVDFNPRMGILTRYGKRLSVGGSHFYAKLTVKGHKDIGQNVEKAE